jgi:hypothetical protein
MKQHVAKAGLWLLTLAMCGTTLAAAQIAPAQIAPAEIAPAQAFSPVRADSGTPDLAIASNSLKDRAVESRQLSTAESSLPDAPSAVAAMQAAQESSSSPTTSPMAVKQKSPRSAASSSMGAAFLIANGAMLGSTIANAAVISNCRPTSCKAVPGAIRSPAGLYGIGIPVTLGVSYISYRLKRSGTKLWILPVAVVTAGNFVYALNASKWSK